MMATLLKVTLCQLLACGLMVSASSPTTIKQVEAFANATKADPDLVFVKVTLQDGTVGLGQCGSPWHDVHQSAWVFGLFQDAIGPVAIGMDAANLAGIEEHMWEQYYKNSGEVFYRALAGFDTAVWDALAKRSNTSVCNYIRKTHFNMSEPCPSSFPVYGSSLSRTVSPRDLADKISTLHHKHGINAFKVKIAQRMGHNVDVYPNRTEEVVAAVRGAIGDDTLLMVDANSGYTDETHAGATADMLANYNVYWFEEPCVWNDLQCAKAVKDNHNVRVAIGEQEYRLYEDWRIILSVNYPQGPVADIAQPDVGYGGGITRALQVVDWTASQNKTFCPHNPGNTMKVMFTLQLMASLPSNVAEPFVEFSCVDGAIPTGIFTPSLELVNGELQLPAGPGWGIDVDLTGATSVVFK
eukprot:TRINITY_DN2798_c0_g1_i1.p1 TRINITY_DN2798_c0_g1~~TRINITY_DN2798_c0_g1_i1.p1  ORF type:complete len:411 (+),score=108.65 TRINITY_DN2798_c0_g1_i1:160-1392(+)